MDICCVTADAAAALLLNCDGNVDAAIQFHFDTNR
jgi:hypothetical protein